MPGRVAPASLPAPRASQVAPNFPEIHPYEILMPLVLAFLRPIISIPPGLIPMNGQVVLLFYETGPSDHLNLAPERGVLRVTAAPPKRTVSFLYVTLPGIYEQTRPITPERPHHLGFRRPRLRARLLRLQSPLYCPPLPRPRLPLPPLPLHRPRRLLRRSPKPTLLTVFCSGRSLDRRFSPLRRTCARGLLG